MFLGGGISVFPELCVRQKGGAVLIFPTGGNDEDVVLPGQFEHLQDPSEHVVSNTSPVVQATKVPVDLRSPSGYFKFLPRPPLLVEAPIQRHFGTDGVV